MIVEVELDGHASECREVTAEGGRVTRIEFQLEPKTLKIEAEVSEIRLFLQDFEWALALSGAAAKKAKVLPPRLKEDLALLFIREKRLKCSDEQNARLDQIRSEYAVHPAEARATSN
jgi:hypothetical protein